MGLGCLSVLGRARLNRLVPAANRWESSQLPRLHQFLGLGARGALQVQHASRPAAARATLGVTADRCPGSRENRGPGATRSLKAAVGVPSRGVAAGLRGSCRSPGGSRAPSRPRVPDRGSAAAVGGNTARYRPDRCEVAYGELNTGALRLICVYLGLVLIFKSLRKSLASRGDWPHWIDRCLSCDPDG